MTAPITRRVVPTKSMTDEEHAALVRLFDASYREANHDYIVKSKLVFRYVAVAECEGEIVAFSFGDSVRTELPRLEGSQQVALAGIACVDDRVRRRGLFASLATDAMLAGGGVDPRERFLFAGRMAHLVTYKTMARMSPSAVPAPGKTLTDWHRDVGLKVGALFGADVDRETLVARGNGTPIGFPRIEYDQTPDEVALFSQVDRQRGDSLLSMCWLPTAPEGW